MILNDHDPEMVEALIHGATIGMSKAVIPEITTHAEVLSATFTLLDRTLRSIRKLQSPSDRAATAAHIKSSLEAMIVDHGHVPH